MKIQAMSDLHIDFTENFMYCRNKLSAVSETLLVTGDFCQYNYKKRNHFINRDLLSKWKNVICVPGNHDFYGKKTDWYMFEKGHEITKKNGNTFHYINNDYIELDGIRYVCTVLWSPIHLHGFEILRGYPDFSEIKKHTLENNNELHRMSVEFLNKAVEESNLPCVILTHHLPLWNFIDERFRHSSFNEAFACDMSDFLSEYSHKIKAWVHGHSHKFLRQEINGVIHVRNPLGYLGAYNGGGEGQDFSPLCTIDV